MEKKQIEPYAKEKSLLQLPLFCFGKTKQEKTFVQWSDSKNKFSLECVCKYGVPGSFEQDVYTASMRIWLKQGMPLDGIILNYSDICRELHLSPPKYYVGQVKEALKKLAQARYEFKQSFFLVIDGRPKKIDTHFSLYDSASLFSYNKNTNRSKRSSESHLIFPEEIRKNLEAKYYQFLDMVWYRSLPEGLPRRLYEYLEKRRYHNLNGIFSIGEEAICRWLPVRDNCVTQRRETLAKTAKKLIDVGYLQGYEFDKKKKICNFTYKEKNKQEKELESAKEDMMEWEEIEETKAEKEEVVTSEKHKNYIEALAWLDSIPYFHKTRKQEIAALSINEVASSYITIKKEYEKKKNAGKTPKAGWVYKAFVEKWDFVDKVKTQRLLLDEKKDQAIEESFNALPKEKQKQLQEEFMKQYEEFPEMAECKGIWLKYMEEAAPKIAISATPGITEAMIKQEEAARQEREKEKKAAQEMIEGKKQTPVFIKEVEKIAPEIRVEMWEKADRSVPENRFARENVLRIKYMSFMWEYLQENGIKYPKEVLCNLSLIFKIEKPCISS